MKRQPLISVHCQKVFDHKGKEIKEGMTIRIKKGKQTISEHKVFKGHTGCLEYEINILHGIMSCFLTCIEKRLKEGEKIFIK